MSSVSTERTMIDNRFVVSDEDGELRRFATKADACAFMQGKEGLVLRVFPPSRKCAPIDPLTLVGECRI
jgi:hypothetical protein